MTLFGLTQSGIVGKHTGEVSRAVRTTSSLGSKKFMKNGTCKLCHRDNVQLCDSHYLPKKSYGITRAPQLQSPHPVVISSKGMRQMSDQLRDYVFCPECEERLNKNGERWVLANIPVDDGAQFPLGAALTALSPISVGADVDLYDIKGISSFDIDKLLYFGLSVFWRGAVHEWETTAGLKAPSVDLCAYEEPIRKFLMGESPWPLDVVITVDIWHSKRVFQAAYPPNASHLADCQCYWFYIPGVIFRLFFGQHIPASIRQRDFRKGTVGVDVPLIQAIWNIARSQAQSSEITPKMQQMLDEVAAIRAKQST